MKLSTPNNFMQTNTNILKMSLTINNALKHCRRCNKYMVTIHIKCDTCNSVLVETRLETIIVGDAPIVVYTI